MNENIIINELITDMKAQEKEIAELKKANKNGSKEYKRKVTQILKIENDYYKLKQANDQLAKELETRKGYADRDYHEINSLQYDADKEIDRLTKALEEWKQIAEDRFTEIAKLKEELAEATKFNDDIVYLHSMIDELQEKVTLMYKALEMACLHLNWRLGYKKTVEYFLIKARKK